MSQNLMEKNKNTQKGKNTYDTQSRGQPAPLPENWQCEKTSNQE
jgi:hypothetical protein